MPNALEQFKQLKPTHKMFDSCRNCGALQGVHENASKERGVEPLGNLNKVDPAQFAWPTL